MGYLVLTRKEGTTLLIGSTVVKFVRIKSGAVRVAIEADGATLILRGEVADKLLANKGKEEID